MNDLKYHVARVREREALEEDGRIFVVQCRSKQIITRHHSVMSVLTVFLLVLVNGTSCI